MCGVTQYWLQVDVEENFSKCLDQLDCHMDVNMSPCMTKQVAPRS
jgi:hypothetical protein